MKKSLLLLASVVMSLSAFAQWTKPTPTATVDMATDGATTQYLYNKDAAGFFAGANDWGTRASVDSAGFGVRITVAYEDKEKTVALDTYNFRVLVGTNWRFLSCNAFDAMWVDAADSVSSSAYPGTDGWAPAKQANGSYKFTNTAAPFKPGTLGVAEIYRGETGNTRLYIANNDTTYEKEVDGEKVKAPYFEGAFWDEWVFISEDEYKTLQPKVAAYTASLALKAALDAAKKDYPSLDFSKPQAVYDKTTSSAEQLKEATTQVQDIITAYKASQATFDKPLDLTEQIGDGSSHAKWTREFTGTGTTGTWETNTWSTEANGGADGTDMLTPFCQSWTGSGGILSDAKIHQTLTAAAPGLYKFTANVRLYNEAGTATELTGCKMYFGNDSIDLSEEVDMYVSGGKQVLWSKNYFSVIAIVKENGDIDFGFDVKSPKFNWMALKNTSLNYYGNADVEANALKLLKASYNLQKAADDTAANAEIIKAYNDAVDKFEAAAAAADIKAAAKEAAAARTALDKNIADYVAFKAKTEEWAKKFESADTFFSDADVEATDEWGEFSDFVDYAGGYDVEDYFPTPKVETVLKEYKLTSEELTAYAAAIDSIYSIAYGSMMKPGMDCSSLLVNPSFAEGFKGWTNKAGNIGDFSKLTPAIPNNVEVYENVVDCYQVVNGLPDGVYSLACKAFERPAPKGQYDGSEPAKVFLYMNEHETAVQNIVADAMPTDKVEDGVNCYKSQTYSEGAGYTLTDELTSYGYVPFGMVGAAVAFNAGRYNQKVYGLVEGGTMKIGLTSKGVKAHWVLWTDFQLTYEGNGADATAAMLQDKIDVLEKYLGLNADKMTTPAVTAAEKEQATAEKAIKDANVEAMTASITAMQTALEDAQKNAAAVKAFKAASDKLTTALDDSTHNPAGEAAAEEIADDIKDYLKLDTEALTELTAKVEKAIDELNTPLFENATDEKPVDCTKLIVNADVNEGATVGWSYTKNGGNGPALANGVGGTPSIEFWNGSATALDFNIYQVLSELPAGTYKLTAQAGNSFNGVDADVTAFAGETPAEGRAYLYAITASATGGSTAVVPQEAAATEVADYEVIFTVAEGDSVTIGFRSMGTMPARWFVADNFKLTYYGKDSKLTPTEDAGEVVGVKAIDVAAPVKKAPAGIFTLSGARVATLQKGINIVRYEDGTVKKVLVK